ncbi:MAG: protein-L-isoaspartate(D-aspartate) O-methyltransferase [Chloroflexota bacterium]
MDLDESRTRLLTHLRWEISDSSVVDAIARVPREAFVPEEMVNAAYDDRPLDIGYGQTISQPYIVALMVEALQLSGDEKVLEVGTGSGYAAAVLSHLAAKVVTVEIVPELEETARSALSRLGYSNVEVHRAGDSLGWLPEAPYDAILVSAGAPSIPPILLGQLKWGGRVVIPLGSRLQQNLSRVTRTADGTHVENLGACYFVPLIGADAWQ